VIRDAGRDFRRKLEANQRRPHQRRRKMCPGSRVFNHLQGALRIGKAGS